MELTSISVTNTLKSVLEDLNITYDKSDSITERVKIYSNGEKPTSQLPIVFIELLENGFLSGSGTELNLLNQTILLSLYVKLSSNGATNKDREQKIISQMEDIFKRGILKDNYFFKLDKRNMFGSSQILVAGYSTKLVNILVTIFNN